MGSKWKLIGDCFMACRRRQWTARQNQQCGCICTCRTRCRGSCSPPRTRSPSHGAIVVRSRHLQNVTTAIGFLAQRTPEQLAGITIMCDGQNVHECTDSEQMVALLQSGRAVFGVSVGSLWHQIKEALEHEEYVDLTKTPASTDTNRPIDDIAAIRMRKKLESRRKSRAAA